MTPWSNRVGKEAMEKNCGVPMARLQGKSWAPHPSKRSAANVGTTSGLPFPSISSIEDGQVRRRPMTLRWAESS
jgi:hypothetical protein